MTKKQKNKAIIAKDDNQKPIVWTKDHEKILVDWGDKAMCYRWLHTKSHQNYSLTNSLFTIPIIIMSTITGTANFAQDRIPANARPYAQMIIGSVNIFAGILGTIAQFLKISELNESHRVSSISWDKFYRNIKIELAKSREERMDAMNMLKICKEEFDRLIETSPSIDQKVINLFNETFKMEMKEIKDEENQIKNNFIKPEICDSLISTSEILYVPKTNDFDLNEPSIINIVRKKKTLLKNYENDVKDWINKFVFKHNRKPLESEIMDNLQGTINEEILKKIVKKIYEENENENEKNV